MRKPLWEVKHPYYCNEGNYFSNGNHHEYKSWQDFFSALGNADMDMNLVFRWDWKEDDLETGESTYTGDDNYRNGRLLLFYMGQRRAKSWSCEVSVCRADEPAAHEFLNKYWQLMKSLWEPFADA